ncbi:MAG: MFS transporter [Pirellulales bacterium]|nr:MFS transporter [Pirellulales bacterium]
MTEARRAWWRELTPYHWLVFIVASACWSFDCLDQRLFSLARQPALKALMPGAEVGVVQATGKEATAIFLVGWGIGGLIFGALGDRYGRAKMLTLTVLLYSIFTGLTYFSRTYWDFALFRFITGLGVGGVFGLAVSLIAETVPDTARTGALGMLQVLSTIGNLTAGAFNSWFQSLEQSEVIAAGNSWRFMFLVGAIPAVLVIFTGKFLKEPEPWLRAKAEGRLAKGSIFAPYAALLAEKRWRKNLLVGAVLASTGVIGLWAIGEYAIDLQRFVFRQHYEAKGLTGPALDKEIASAITLAYTLNMLGAATGMWIFTRIAMAYGRRPAFAMGFTAALIVTVLAYWLMETPTQAYIWMPLMGAVQLGPFAGFAIYLPELFPSRMRSTGTSFCYNLGRFAAAAGSLFSAKLATGVYGHHGSPLMERYSAMTMCVIFLAGLAILPFAPETKDKPLPE